MRKVLCVSTLVLLVFSFVQHCAWVQLCFVESIFAFREGQFRRFSDLFIVSLMFGAHLGFGVYVFNKLPAYCFSRSRYVFVIPVLVIGFFIASTVAEFYGRDFSRNFFFEVLDYGISNIFRYFFAFVALLGFMPMLSGIVLAYFQKCPPKEASQPPPVG